MVQVRFKIELINFLYQNKLETSPYKLKIRKKIQTYYNQLYILSCLKHFTRKVVRPVVDINVTDADHGSQVHPPRR